LRHYDESRKVTGSVPDEVIGFILFISALRSTQPLTETNPRNIPGGKGRPARKADNLTVICEPITYKMWELRRLITLWAFTAGYRDSFIFEEECAGFVTLES
jgi:hypothetical protein